MPQYWDITDDDQFRNFQAHRSMLIVSGKTLRIEIVNDDPKQRTTTQNNCMHQWHKDCATALRDAGLDLTEVLKDARVPVTQSNFMENVWRPVQIALTGKKSSTKPTTTEYSDIYEVIVQIMAERVGITLPPWPSRFNHEEQTT